MNSTSFPGNPGQTRPSLVFLIAVVGALSVAGPLVALAVDYETVQILDHRRAFDLAMVDDNRVVVTSTVYQGQYSQVVTRQFLNHQLQSPVVLDEQAPTNVVPALVACSRGFFLAYASGTSILVRQGDGQSWSNPVTLTSGPGPAWAAHLNVDPHGTVHLLFEKGANTWWSSNPPETGQWSAPQLAWAGVTSGRLEFKWLHGDWQPRIYAVDRLNMEPFVYRQFDGTTWQPPVILIESYGGLYGDFRVGHRADGRHFLAFGLGAFTVRTFEENGSGAFLPAGDRVTDFGTGCWESMNPVRASFDLASDPDGTIHLFRYQENWRWEDNDLWLCGYDVYWERSPANGGAWIESPPGFFHGTSVTGFDMFVTTPTTGGGPPAFCWYDGSARLRVSNFSADAPIPAGAVATFLEVVPNPSSGPVAIRWSGPAPTLVGGLSVFGIDGRRVRTLSLDPQGRAAWDGRDDEGRPVGSGVYLLRAEASRNLRAARHFVILR